MKEEGFKTNGYVPTRNGKPIGKSGVTIGKGFDIGQFRIGELRKMGIERRTLRKIAPYAGKTGKAAQEKLESTPLSLTEDEAKALSKKVLGLHETRAGKVIKNIERTGRSLTENQKLAITSMVFQGVSPASFPNSFNAFKRGDIEAARRGFMNSKWAKKQTPERARRVVKALLDDVPIMNEVS